MKRTQLYLDENMKKTRDSKSLLLQAFGVWKDRKDMRDSDSYVRKIRKGKRIERLYKTPYPEQKALPNERN